MPRQTTSLSSLLLTVALAPACGGNNLPGPTEQPTPPISISEPFQGTVTVNGAVTHPFTVQDDGEVRATLSAVEPDSAVVLGLSLGTWNGTACQIVLAADNATQGTTIIGNATVVGNFCVRVYDVGKLTAPASYKVDVTHF